MQQVSGNSELCTRTAVLYMANEACRFTVALRQDKLSPYQCVCVLWSSYPDTVQTSFYNATVALSLLVPMYVCEATTWPGYCCDGLCASCPVLSDAV